MGRVMNPPLFDANMVENRNGISTVLRVLHCL